MSTFLTENEAREAARQLLDQQPVDIKQIQKEFPQLRDCSVYEGKVTTSIYGEHLITNDGVPLRIMIRTPRISTHDKNRGMIPFKDQVLAKNHEFMRKMLKPQLRHAQLEVPGLEDESIVTVSRNLDPFMIEVVLRMYNAYTDTETSLYVHHKNGATTFCGHELPEDLVPNGVLPYLMDTPSTKEKNDQSISPDECIERGLCTQKQYQLISEKAKTAFGTVSDWLYERKNIILADTKLEFGIDPVSRKIYAMDELFTMDSSRYWPYRNWKKALGKEERVKSWSKEFARGIGNKDAYSDEDRVRIAVNYILGIQELTGEPFMPNMQTAQDQVEKEIRNILNYFCL